MFTMSTGTLLNKRASFIRAAHQNNKNINSEKDHVRLQYRIKIGTTTVIIAHSEIKDNRMWLLPLLLKIGVKADPKTFFDEIEPA